jgi:hypothetical protein
MKLYIAQCYDRHIDPVIRVFDTPDAAISYAKKFVHDNARYTEDVKEINYNWALYYCEYSSEGDRVYVQDGKLNSE